MTAAVLAAAPVYGTGLSIFDGLASEVDNIASAAKPSYPESCVALDDIGISVDTAEYEYTAIRQKEGFV